jgi:hypothetical protein
VVNRDAMRRVGVEGGLLRASELAVVGELVTPDPLRIDTVDKRREYADAGIPRYWIIDINIGTFTTEEPFPVTVELDRLR